MAKSDMRISKGKETVAAACCGATESRGLWNKVFWAAFLGSMAAYFALFILAWLLTYIAVR